MGRKPSNWRQYAGKLHGDATWSDLFTELERICNRSEIKNRTVIQDIISHLMPPPDPDCLFQMPKPIYTNGRRNVVTPVRWKSNTMNMTLDFELPTRPENAIRALPRQERNEASAWVRYWTNHMPHLVLEHLFLGVWDGEWRFQPISEACRRRYWNTPIRETLLSLERQILVPELYNSLMLPCARILDLYDRLGPDKAGQLQAAMRTLADGIWKGAPDFYTRPDELKGILASSRYLPDWDVIHEPLPGPEDEVDIALSMHKRLDPLMSKWPDVEDFFDISDENAEATLLDTVAYILCRRVGRSTDIARRIQDIYIAIVFHTNCPLADDKEFVIFDTSQVLKAAFGSLPGWFDPDLSLCPPGCRNNRELHERLAAARAYFLDHELENVVKPDLAIVVSRPGRERRTGGTWLHWDADDENAVPLPGPVLSPKEDWQPCPDEEVEDISCLKNQ